MPAKQRLSVTVDSALLTAAEKAVAGGASESLSAWVNDALAQKLARDARLAALRAALAAFEREHGSISEAEMAEAAREARRRATPARGTRAGESRRRYGR